MTELAEEQIPPSSNVMSPEHLFALQREVEALVDAYSEALRRHREEQDSIAHIDTIIQKSKNEIEDVKQTSPLSAKPFAEVSSVASNSNKQGILKLEALLKEQEEKCNTLIHDREQLEKDLKAKLQESQKQHGQLQKQKASLQKEIESLKNANSDNEMIISVHKSDASKKDQQIKENEQRVNTSKSEIQKLKVEHADALSKLEKRNQELMQENTTFLQREKELQTDLNKAYQQNTKLSAGFADLQKKHHSLELALKKLKRQSEYANDECAQLKTTVEETKSLLRQAKEEVNEKQQTILNLNERVKVASSNVAIVEQQLKEETHVSRRLKIILTLGIILLLQYIVAKRLRDLYLEDIVLT